MFMRRPAVEYWPTCEPPISELIVVAMSLTLTLTSDAAGRSGDTASSGGPSW